MQKRNIQSLYAALIMLTFFVLLALPVFTNPIFSDSVAYLKLSESIKNDLSYSVDGTVHKSFPPLFPLSIVPFIYILGNPVFALKISAMLGGLAVIIFTYFLARQERLKPFWCLIAALLVMLNPWFMYFSSINLPLSEGLATALFIGGLICYRSDANKRFLLSGILFGLSVVTRIPFIFLISPFILVSLVSILKKKRISDNILFVFMSTAPFGLWILRNLLIKTTTSASMGHYSSNLSYWMTFPQSTAVYALTLFITLHLLSLPAILAIHSSIKNRDRFYILISLGFLTYIISLIFLTGNTGNLLYILTKRPRYLLPLLPILSVLSVRFILSIKRPSILYRYKTLLKKYIYLTLVCSLAAGILINYGAVQNSIYESYPVYQTLMQRSDMRQDAIQWINHNAELESTVCGDLVSPEPEFVSGFNEYIGYYLRSDIGYINLALYSADDPAAAKTDTQACDYILTEKTADQTALETGLEGLEIAHQEGSKNTVYVFRAG